MHRARARLRECLEAKGFGKPGPSAGVSHDLVQERNEASHVRPASGAELVEAAGGARSSCYVQILLPPGSPDRAATFGHSTPERTRRNELRIRRPSDTTVIGTIGLARCFQIPMNSRRYAFLEESQQRHDNHGLE